jgi:predicted nucleic acid-binding protein
MILADTSVWVAHFRAGLPGLAHALEHGIVLLHPVIIGELATGNLKNRKQVLSDLRLLPCAQTGPFNECLQFLESQKLYGSGIGWSDIQLLYSAKISDAHLWTLDKRLATAARKIGA